MKYLRLEPILHKLELEVEFKLDARVDSSGDGILAAPKLDDDDDGDVDELRALVLELLLLWDES